VVPRRGSEKVILVIKYSAISDNFSVDSGKFGKWIGNSTLYGNYIFLILAEAKALFLVPKKVL
jgi:hypothetical protein